MISMTFYTMIPQHQSIRSGFLKSASQSIREGVRTHALLDASNKGIQLDQLTSLHKCSIAIQPAVDTQFSTGCGSRHWNNLIAVHFLTLL